MTINNPMSHKADNKPESGEKRAYWKFSPINYFLFVLGVFLLIIGFISLYFVDPHAENALGLVAPLMIISAYVSIFLALIIVKHQ